MADPTIRLHVDAKDVESTFERVKKIAQETAANMIADAEKRVGTSREMIKSLEDEIKLMEREQHMATTERRMGAEDRRAAGGSEKSYDKELAEIKIDDKEAKLHTELLRDIIDAVLATGRAEVEENKKGVVERLSRMPKDARDFKSRYQAGLIGEEGEDERRAHRGLAGGIRSYGSSIVGARDPISGGLDIVGQAGGEMLAMGGTAALIGAGVTLAAMAGKRLWDAAGSFHKEANRAMALAGEDVMTFEAGKGYEKYGVSSKDYASRATPLMRARRSSSGIQQSVEDQILLERGMGVESSAYNSIEQLSYLKGKTGMASTQEAAWALREGGIIKGDDMSPLQDYLQIMVSLGKEQVQRLGKVDMGINTRVVAALGSMNETMQKSPEAVQSMINSIRGGLTSSSSTQVQALQYSVLSNIRPGADMQELNEMREDPFSEKSIRYMPEYLKALKKMSGGNDRQLMLAIAKQFGLSAIQSHNLADFYNSGDLEKSLAKDPTGKIAVENLGKKAEKATSMQEVKSAQMENDIANIALNVGKIVDKMDPYMAQIGQNYIPKEARQPPLKVGK